MQGATAALQALTVQFGAVLPKQLPLLWSLAAIPLMTSSCEGLPSAGKPSSAESIQALAAAPLHHTGMFIHAQALEAQSSKMTEFLRSQRSTHNKSLSLTQT